ncbi:MAG: CTP synthase [Oligoflexales bacterium]
MQSQSSHTKYVFITGGVVSSLGKGIISASLGSLLEARGLKLSFSKADPYINIDPGTMSPCQHGEVFVTDDGAETDLDLGHYERFTQVVLNRNNSFSAGKVYDHVLTRERNGEFLGHTVQVVPHITDQIKQQIFQASEGADLALIEIGGTVGDIESLPFIEAIRQMRHDVGPENILYIHLTLVPWLAGAQELKTKPTQHSVKELLSSGIQPDILVCRTERELPDDLRQKIARFCNVPTSNVVEARDLDSIYAVPLALQAEGLDTLVAKHLNIWSRAPDLTAWQHKVDQLRHSNHEINVAIVGKYVDVVDSYKSIHESLVHAGIEAGCQIKPHYLDTSDITTDNAAKILNQYDAILVPGGFGSRGVEGKIATIQAARENKIPFLGICLGMQLACIEFARNVIGLKGANSEEFDAKTPHKIIGLLDNQKDIEQLGGTMRLGGYPCRIKPESRSYELYQSLDISERHRHRYEFNNDYRQQFEKAGLSFAGCSPDEKLVEIVELYNHPFYIGCQFHPELKSRLMQPHPLFKGFVNAAVAFQQANRGRYERTESPRHIPHTSHMGGQRATNLTH